MNFEEVLAAYNGLPEADRAELRGVVKQAGLDKQKFVPSPGPQTEAWFCPADLLLYGGEGGGGKTGLLCGLALVEHTSSLLMRRRYSDHFGVGGLIEEIKKLNGGDGSFNGSAPATLKPSPDRIITFGGAEHVGDEQRFQGKARDFLGVDEAAQFAETQIRFLMGWVRSTTKGQRCRTVLASNAPIAGVGEWLVGMFRPWLDPTHPRPAKQGELRWFITVRKAGMINETEDVEVDGPEPVERDGEVFKPSSRTFIRARLGDNPFLGEDYQRTLDALPEPYRSAVRDGNFMAARQDDQWQVIPTAWIREAQARWTPDPPSHAPMSAVGVDVAQGGSDQTVLAYRYDSWFAPIEAHPGAETPTGAEVAGLVVARRRNNAVVVVDLGGGWGGEAYGRLKENGIECRGHRGMDPSTRRTADNTLRFFNKRAEVWWRLREALDPGQDGGSPIALPDDPELMADLTSCRFEVGPRGIKIESKDDVVKRLGRSPDKGDAVTLAWAAGPKLATHGNQWRRALKTQGQTVRVDMGRSAVRRRRR